MIRSLSIVVPVVKAWFKLSASMVSRRATPGARCAAASVICRSRCRETDVHANVVCGQSLCDRWPASSAVAMTSGMVQRPPSGVSGGTLPSGSSGFTPGHVFKRGQHCPHHCCCCRCCLDSSQVLDIFNGGFSEPLIAPNNRARELHISCAGGSAGRARCRKRRARKCGVRVRSAVVTGPTLVPPYCW